jgi:hypothetical protein
VLIHIFSNLVQGGVIKRYYCKNKMIKMRRRRAESQEVISHTSQSSKRGQDTVSTKRAGTARDDIYSTQVDNSRIGERTTLSETVSSPSRYGFFSRKNVQMLRKIN